MGTASSGKERGKKTTTEVKEDWSSKVWPKVSWPYFSSERLSVESQVSLLSGLIMCLWESSLW